MAEFFGSPHIADLILAVLVAEGLFLVLRHARSGRPPSPRSFLPFLAAGACLTLALRSALAEAPWPWLAVALVGAGVAHLADLSMRGRD